MDSTNAKLIDALKGYADSGPARFHMPGHKGFMSYEPFGHLAPLDVTELTDTDDLHSPKGVLLGLEKRYASLYGAKASLLLINGSTAGNIAMLMSLGCGKRILLARNCHRSALSGIALAGHDVISIFPSETSGAITPEQVDAVLNKSPADAVFITSPTYCGVCCDVKGIAAATHRHGALLFVDSAHGAHFPFSELLPPAPVDADAWVVSCHKTLNAFTQTAVLHIGQSNPILADEMRRMLSLVQSSSPSYPLMLSLENAIDNIGDWNAHCKRIQLLRNRISAMDGIHLFETGDNSRQDITRLVFGADGITGYELGAFLEGNGIFPEMCDMDNAVLITSPNDPEIWYARLIDALGKLPRSSSCQSVSCVYLSQSYARTTESAIRPTGFLAVKNPTNAGKSALSVREAMLGKTELLPLDTAEGRISAQAVGIYPPGVATLFPGEVIEQSAIDILKLNISLGAKLFGTVDGMVSVVKQTDAAETKLV
ncbi:MAG: aminotransferase class V-fold PLP-dependent enzyme [Christensenellaceae bacterium]|nr:aminotransferase class V-fold PLP-dependent enzyme [Christensenellaceae bacterium]